MFLWELLNDHGSAFLVQKPSKVNKTIFSLNIMVHNPLSSDSNVNKSYIIWAPSSEFVSSSIPSWQISTAHAQPFRGARDLVFCLTVPLDSMLVWASSGGSGETARMRRLAWTFAARICDKYQIRLTRSIYKTHDPSSLWCILQAQILP